MRNFIKSMVTAVKAKVQAVKARIRTAVFCFKVMLACPKLALCNRRGENFVDSGFKVLIIVVLAALFLAGLYFLLGDVIMPTLTQRVRDLFNYRG